MAPHPVCSAAPIPEGAAVCGSCACISTAAYPPQHFDLDQTDFKGEETNVPSKLLKNPIIQLLCEGCGGDAGTAETRSLSL